MSWKLNWRTAASLAFQIYCLDIRSQEVAVVASISIKHIALWFAHYTRAGSGYDTVRCAPRDRDAKSIIGTFPYVGRPLRPVDAARAGVGKCRANAHNGWQLIFGLGTSRLDILLEILE